jgi:hypothetical protein
MFEFWEEYIKGYYDASTFGNIRSVDRLIKSRHGTPSVRRGKILKSTLDTGGYPCVMICVAGEKKLVRVHRIIATVFVKNPHHLNTVNHIDRDRTNNRADNLEWISQAENVKHGLGYGRYKRDRG